MPPVEAGREERVRTDLNEIVGPMSPASKSNTVFDYLVLLFLASGGELDA